MNIVKDSGVKDPMHYARVYLVMISSAVFW